MSSCFRGYDTDPKWQGSVELLFMKPSSSLVMIPSNPVQGALMLDDLVSGALGVQRPLGYRIEPVPRTSRISWRLCMYTGLAISELPKSVP